MADGSTNLQIQQQITAMYQAQNQQLTAQARLMRGQLAMMEQMVAVQQNLNIDDVRNQFAGARQELDALDQMLQNMGGSGQAAFGQITAGANTSAGAVNALGNSFIAVGNQAQKLGALGMMLEGMKKGWDFVTHSISATGNILGTVWQAMKDIGTTIIGALIGPFEALFDMANKSVGSNDFMVAREEVRKFFGSLVTNEGAAVLKMYGDLRKGIAETGLSAYRILGDRAAQLRAMNEIAQGLGNTFGVLVNQGLIKSAGAVVAFQKGLGITNEQMKEFGRVAITTGRSLDEVFRETSNYAIQLGKSFGISSKLIGRDIAEMTADLKHFGGLGVKAFAEVSVYARKLGVEIKTLTNLMDAFDNFDSAADATARLNQQFGIQLDTLQLLKAENPAERAELLRKSFDQAGISVTDLDRRSKTYLASQLKLNESELELLFNSKNRGMSLDEIRKKSGEAEKKQLSQAEATKLLADNIERVIRAMQGSGGLFDRFIQGFFRGIEITREFRQIMINIRQIFRAVYWAGRELGQAFVKDFPGIREIFGGYADFFDPARWRKMFSSITGAFKEFFKTIQTDPSAGLEVLWTKLKAAFFGHMDSSEPAGQKLINGFKKFFGTILNVAVGVIKTILPEILKSLTDGLRYLNRVLRGEESGLSIDFAGAWNTIKSSFSNLWTELKDLFSVVLPPLWDEFVKQLEALGAWIWPRITGWLERNWKTVVISLGAFLAGPAIVGMLMSGLGSLFAGALGNALGGLLGGSGPNAQGAQAAAQNAQQTGAAAQQVVTSQTSTAQTITSSTDALVEAAAKVATLLGAAGAITLLINKIIETAEDIKTKNLSLSDVGIAGGVFLAAGLFIVMMAETFMKISQIGITGAIVAGAVAAIAALGLSTQTGQNAIQSAAGLLITAIDGLTSPGGPLEKIFQFGKRLAELGQQPGANPDETKSILIEIGGVLIGVIGFLVQMVPLIKDINDLKLDATTSQTLATNIENIFTPISAFITGIVTNLSAIDVGKIKAIADMSGFISALATLITGIASLLSIVHGGGSGGGAAGGGGGAGGGGFVNAVVEGGRRAWNFITSSVGVGGGGGGGTAAPATAAAGIARTLDFSWINTLLSSVSTAITNIIEASRAFSGMDPETVKSIGQATSSIVSSTAEAMSAIVGVFTGDNITQLLSQNNPEQKINLLKDFIQDMVNTLFAGQGENTFVGAIKTYIQSVVEMTRTLSPQQIQGIGAVASLISSILSGLSGMTAAVMNFANLAQSGGGVLGGGTIDPIILGDLMQFFGRMFDQLKTFLPDIMRNIQAAFNGIDLNTFKSQVEALEPLLRTLNQLSTLTKNMLDIVLEAGGGTGDQTSFLEGLRRLQFIFKAPGPEGSDPSIFSIIRSIIANLPGIQMNQSIDLSGTVTAINQLKEIGIALGAIKSVPALFDMETLRKTWMLFKAGGGDKYPSIFSILREIKTQLPNAQMIQSIDLSGTVTAVNQLKEIALSFAEMPSSSALEGVDNALDLMPGLISKLQTVLTGVENVEISNSTIKNINRLNKAGPRLSRLSQTISNTVLGFTPAISSVGDGVRGTVAEMLGTIEDTVNAVNRIGTIPLTTTLDRLSDNLGLGRSASYTIRNQNFNVTIQLKVVMDAGDFERVFAERAVEATTTKSGEFDTKAFNKLPARQGGDGEG